MIPPRPPQPARQPAQQPTVIVDDYRNSLEELFGSVPVPVQPSPLCAPQMSPTFVAEEDKIQASFEASAAWELAELGERLASTRDQLTATEDARVNQLAAVEAALETSKHEQLGLRQALSESAAALGSAQQTHHNQMESLKAAAKRKVALLQTALAAAQAQAKSAGSEGEDSARSVAASVAAELERACKAVSKDNASSERCSTKLGGRQLELEKALKEGGTQQQTAANTKIAELQKALDEAATDKKATSQQHGAEVAELQKALDELNQKFGQNSAQIETDKQALGDQLRQSQEELAKVETELDAMHAEADTAALMDHLDSVTQAEPLRWAQAALHDQARELTVAQACAESRQLLVDEMAEKLQAAQNSLDEKDAELQVKRVQTWPVGGG